MPAAGRWRLAFQPPQGRDSRAGESQAGSGGPAHRPAPRPPPPAIRRAPHGRSGLAGLGSGLLHPRRRANRFLSLQTACPKPSGADRLTQLQPQLQPRKISKGRRTQESQVRMGGAGGARSHDRRIMRTLTRLPSFATCADVAPTAPGSPLCARFAGSPLAAPLAGPGERAASIPANS